MVKHIYVQTHLCSSRNKKSYFNLININHHCYINELVKINLYCV